MYHQMIQSAILHYALRLYLCALYVSQNKRRLLPHTPFTDMFLGAFAKLRKPAISFVMSFRPSVSVSVRMEQLGSHWTDFHEI